MDRLGFRPTPFGEWHLKNVFLGLLLVHREYLTARLIQTHKDVC